MGQVLHGSARTTEAVRRAIQLRQESVRAAARRYGVSPTTVQKWRKRQTTADARMGPKGARSTVLTPEEEAIVVAFRETIGNFVWAGMLGAKEPGHATTQRAQDT